MGTRRPLHPVLAATLAAALFLSLVPGASAGVSGDEPAAGSPASPEPGLYVLPPGATAPAGLVRLHMTMPEKIHQSGTLAMTLTFGHTKGHEHARYTGARSAVRVPAGNVALYLYFADSAGKAMDPQDPMAAMAALQSFSGDAPPPTADDAAQFELVQLHGDADGRTVETGTVGGSKGGSGESRDAVAVRVEKIGPHGFEVTPAASLAPGEYGLLYIGQGPGAQIWDFGVDSN